MVGRKRRKGEGWAGEREGEKEGCRPAEPASPSLVPPSSHGLPAVCLSVSKLPLFMRTPVMLDQGPP